LRVDIFHISDLSNRLAVKATTALDAPMNHVEKRVDVFVCSKYFGGKLQGNFDVRFRIDGVIKTSAD
jgi:hypothetical protein